MGTKQITNNTLQSEAVEVINAPIQREWLSRRDVSIEYGLSISTLSKWAMTNKNLPFSKIGKYCKYRRSDVEKFLNDNIIEVVA